MDRAGPGHRGGEPRCPRIYEAVQSLRTMAYRGRYERVVNTRELVILNVLHGAQRWP